MLVPSPRARLAAGLRLVRDWPALPGPDISDTNNAEIFGVGVRPFTFRLDFLFSASDLEARFHEAGFDTVTAAQLTGTNVLDRFETWFLYNPGDWSEWSRIKPDGEDNFPVTGAVRPEYDVAGADAVVRVYASVDRMTPGIEGGRRSDNVMWSAAAKPFGYLEEGSERRPATDASAFVLPAFRDVRLIPVDAATGSENNTSDIEWVRHVRSHLHPYLESGPQLNACRYCSALTLWEDDAFRQQGIDWLDLYHQNCRVRTPGATVAAAAAGGDTDEREGQRPEVRGQRPEVSGQRSEARGQRSAVRGQRPGGH